MYCPNCGKENPDHALFCASCGEDLRSLIDPTEEVVWEEGPSEWTDEGYDPIPDFAPDRPFEGEKKRSILGISLVLEGVVLTILLVILFLNLGQNRSPRLAAEKTFVALTNGNLEEALRHMDVKDSPFTRKENLRKAWHSWGFDQVTSYRIAGPKEEGGDVKADQVDIPISYTAKDLEGDHEVTLSMVKDPSAFFLDNPWKVSSDYFFVKDLEVIVPEGVSVRLDGEEPPLDRSRKEGDHISYLIPQAFTGVHSLEIAKDDRAIQANYYVDRDNKTILMGWDSGEDSLDGETILKTIRENIEKIAKTFIEQGSFSSIRSLFAEDRVDEVKKKYEEAFANYEMLPFIQSFEVRSMDAQLDKEEQVVYLSMDYRVRYYTIPEDNKLVIQETRGERDLIIHYEEENGTIKQADLGLAVPLEYVR